MFERLTSTILQGALQEYFVLDANDANVMDVWSGFIRWNQMELRTEWLNEKIQAKGLPFEVIHGHVSLLTISIPWSKLNLLSGKAVQKKKRKESGNGDAGAVVLVLDGVQLLVRTKYEFDDDALNQARIKSRRKKLQQASSSVSGDKTFSSSSSSSSWGESLRQRFKDGVVPQLADNLHLHIRDLHIRLEDIQSSPNIPMAVGIVLESLHLQQAEKCDPAEDPNCVQKGSQVNHFAIYANALDETPESNQQKWSERSILQHCTQRDVVIEILDGSIPRRANSLEATKRMAPQHTYVLSPVDATAHLQSGTDPSLLVSQSRPVFEVNVHVPAVHMALQDVHVHAGIAWYYRYQDHKYRTRYRPFRPRVSVAADPRAWWNYATTAIRHELQQSRLQWSWLRFQKRYLVRKRYCDLYERKKRSEIEESRVLVSPLSAAESDELQAMEDGTVGELALEDIVLYRAIVQLRIGEVGSRHSITKRRSSILQPASWTQKTLLGMVEDDSAASDEFQRAVNLWEEAQKGLGAPLEESTSWVALSIQFTVDEGIVAAYTPLSSTLDQSSSKRLQVLFLSFVFSKFHAHGRLLGDFESMRLDTELHDFYAEEERSNRMRHTVIQRELLPNKSFLPEATPIPFLKFRFLKNSKQTNDFHMGIHAEIQKLVLTLEPTCEWIQNGRSLVRPLPKIDKIKEFWDDVGMNFINTMSNAGREIFAKAETAVADHKNIDVDIWIDCPLLRINGEDPSAFFVVDFGKIRVRTERLAGVAKSKLIGTLRNEAMRRSQIDDSDELVENDVSFLRGNTAINDSMRSGNFNDMIDGIQVFRDDMTALDNLAHTPGEYMSGGIESFFYDTYAVDIKTGAARIENLDSMFDVVEPIEVTATIQRSIIPRDATLFRYKLLYSVGDVMLTTSRDTVLRLHDILSTWGSVVSRRAPLESPDLSVHHASIGLFLNGTTEGEYTFNGAAEYCSDFDEDEFFDTMEHESAFSDLDTAMAGENFMAESDSVLDSDSQSLARSVRSRRKRQASISDVSSISEGSATKRRGGQNETPYLSAENLARLEEDADEEDADDLDETRDIDIDSFQSAVSASQVLNLIRNLDDDIQEAHSSLTRLREKLAEFRAPESAGLHGDKAQRQKLKNALQLEVERIRAELLAMTATREDLHSRISTLPSSGMSVSKDANRSMEMASILLQTRRKRGSVGVEQSLVGNWSRRTLQISGTVESITTRFFFRSGLDNDCRSCFWFRTVNSSLVFISNTNEKKIFLSNESLTAGINEVENEKSRHVFVGGNADDYYSDLLSARFPHFVPPQAVDEKLFRVAITIVNTKPELNLHSRRLVRVRVAVGDFQMTPCPSYLEGLKSFVSRLKQQSQEVVSEKSTRKDQREKKDRSKPFYYDSLFTLSSCKIVEGESGSVAAVINDVTTRLSGVATSQIYKERTQVDLRVGDLQVLYLGQRNISQPAEVLCKRDAYAPLMRVRIRAQKALPSDPPGWVVGQALPASAMTQNRGTPPLAIRNIHSSVQIEALNLMVSHEVVESFCTVKDSWKGIFLSHEKNGKKSQVHSTRFKIRIDAMMRKLTIVCANNVDDLVSDDVSPRRVMLNLDFSSSVQIDSNKDLIARTRLDDVSVRLPNEQIQVSFVKPFSVQLLVDRRGERTLGHSNSPIMKGPETFAWICEQAVADPVVFPERTIGSTGILVTLLTTPCDFNLRPKSAAFATSLVNNLMQGFKRKGNIATETPVVADKKTELLDEQRSTMIFRASLDTIRASFFEEPHKTLPRSIGPQFQLCARNIMVVFNKQCDGASLWTRLKEVETIDFSLRRGIQSLGSSALRLKGVVSDDNTAMLEVDASFLRNTEKTIVQLSISLRHLQILLLPSLVRSTVAFKREFSSALGPQRTTVKTGSKGLDKPLKEGTEWRIFVDLDLLEVLIPTTDISKTFRETGGGYVGVVSVRYGLEFRNVFSSDDFTRLIEIGQTDNLTVEGVKTAFEEFFARRKDQIDAGNVVTMSTQLLFHDFQILRTTARLPSTDSIAFETAGSSSREQRVTNSFCFAFRHEVAATLLEDERVHGEKSTRVSISQAAEVKSEFVDVLVYIARSDRGVNTAIEATIRPILNMFKDRSGTKGQGHEGRKPSRLSSLLSLLAVSTTAISLRSEGIQVTCVPGGATRLTESPIIKFTLFRIAAGCGLIGQPVSPEIRLSSSTSLDGIHADANKEYRHLLTGGWMSCEISAYYHNRRLVEWEPFIEPWCFVVRLGIDLMRMLRLEAIPIELDVSLEIGVNEKQIDRTPSSAVARLANLSRLLRSPFGAVQESSGVLSRAGPAMTDTDICGLILQSRVADMLQAATFRTPDVSTRVQLPLLPSQNALNWMQGHGYPGRNDFATSIIDPALLCHISDEGPLGINVTGAMIDTVGQYLNKKQEHDAAPHLIQNCVGLTIRFQEVLDNDRSATGERAPKVTIESGRAAPLSLRRSLSQSCDPHKAYITVELGTFDETIGRVSAEPQRTSKGSRSSVFSYRISSKVPVDTVGVTRYPLELISDKSGIIGNLGYIIVKVRLEGGTKVVSIESPLLLSNTSNQGLFFEMRENNGVSVLWRSYLETVAPGETVPVPADLTVSVYTKTCKLFLVSVSGKVLDEGAEFVATSDEDFVENLRFPPPFSKSSLSRGILSETDVSIRVIDSSDDNGLAHVNACSLRVGSISLEQTEKVARVREEPPEIPEQRVLLFRSSILFRNHLALPVELQVRTVSFTKPISLLRQVDSHNKTREELSWKKVGRLDCGASRSWTGAAPWETLEIRFRFVEAKGASHRMFPTWSTPAIIPPDGNSSLGANRTRKSLSYSRSSLEGMTVFDSETRRLSIALDLIQGTAGKASPSSAMECYLDKLSSSGRIVALYAPFWIIDQSGLDLQFRSGGLIAGQEKVFAGNQIDREEGESLGLGELLDDRNMSHLPSRIPFRVYMIGEPGSSVFNIRIGKNRIGTYELSWSTPVHLSKSRRSVRDTVVVSPGKTSLDVLSAEETGRESFVVRTRVIDAPEQYGGSYGTRLVHIVCKYAVVNELGHDIEILSGIEREDHSLSVKADSSPRPLSFISGRMRFRPKMVGWCWSGSFKVTLYRKDVTLRLRHSRKGHTMIASIEFHPGETPGTCVIVFRKASHAPYRVENHSMFPLMYFQRSPFSQSGLSKPSSVREQQDGIVLPFHSASFAYDEPEALWRSVGIQFADFGLLPSQMNKEFLGSFDLDRLSPGTEVQLPGDEGLVAKVMSDGPTRILRITEVSSGESLGQASPIKQRTAERHSLFPTIAAQIRLRSGFGVSVVDWTPQELLYIDLQDILGEIEVQNGKETASLSVGYAAINNQLWVTPYPVAMSIGSRSTRNTRRRNRRVAKALSCSWNRSLSIDESFDGVTLLGKVDVSSEPIDIRIDGRLACLVVDMAKQMRKVFASQVVARSKGDKTNGKNFQGDFLSMDEGHDDLVEELYSSVDSMATNTIAAKLRHNYRPIHLTKNINTRKATSGASVPFAKSSRKFYIERLRVSITSLNLSWHGFLPLNSVIRPAFFFEGLPIFLRAYVSSHVYGSVQDLVRGALSHYITVGRLVDVTFGAMIRKPFFFPREILTYVLTGIAGTLQVAERSLLAVAHASSESPARNHFYENFILPLTTLSAAFLRGGVHVLQLGSSLVRYGSITPKPTGAQLRSRNPRFFAHIDGNDLLVEYVEGENAGKALLSRVRMGENLVEGYAYHVDDVFEARLVDDANFQMDDNTLILMMTHERLMLLRGQLDDSFCRVAWEVTFRDVSDVECVRVSDAPSSHDLFTIWYLRELRKHEDGEDSITRTAAVGSSGLGLLHPMNIFVPRSMAKRLMETIRRAK